MSVTSLKDQLFRYLSCCGVGTDGKYGIKPAGSRDPGNAVTAIAGNILGLRE